MRGYPRFNFDAFARGAAYLRSRGHEVVSPAEMDLADGFDPDNPGEITQERYETWMKRDLFAIENCEAIALLPGWRMSEGAMREYKHAAERGLTSIVLHEEDLNVVDGCPHCEVGAEHVFDQPAIRPDGCPHCEVGAVVLPQNATVDAIDRLLGEVRVTNEKTGGQKGSKPERFDLIPAAALRKVARLYGRGAQKYADHNWRKGYNWSLSIAALERHLAAFKEGEDFDKETQCEHLASVVFHALALLVYADEHPELDDRWKGAK